MKNQMEDIINTILADYKPEVKYLQEARVLHTDPLEIKGTFRVENSVHLIGNLEHLAISETALCLNQIERVLSAYLVEDGFIKEWGCLNFCKWNSSILGNEGLVIVNEEITFKKMISPGIFDGIIKMEDWNLSRNNNYHIQLTFDMANRSHFGTMRICFIPSVMKRCSLTELQ